MRHISFALTTQQIRRREKRVTRRLGWKHLKVGELLQGIVKGQGLKKGETVEKLAVIVMKSVRREPLRRMTDDTKYGFDEVKQEGFEGHLIWGWPSGFVDHFCRSHKGCTPETEVTRIEFDYVEAGSTK